VNFAGIETTPLCAKGPLTGVKLVDMLQEAQIAARARIGSRDFVIMVCCMKFYSQEITGAFLIFERRTEEVFLLIGYDFTQRMKTSQEFLSARWVVFDLFRCNPRQPSEIIRCQIGTPDTPWEAGVPDDTGTRTD